MNNLKKVLSGSAILDELLEGGFEPEIITTIYGGAATGKTNICLLTAVNVARSGKKVVFVDTESGFSPERLKQIAPKDYKEIMKKITIFEPSDFNEQTEDFKKVKDLVLKGNVGLVIVDSMAMHYRLEMKSHEEAYGVNKTLAFQLKLLKEISKTGIPVIMTNQVYSDFDNKDEVKMVGGTLPMYFSKCIIKLENYNGSRKATLGKHRSIPEGKSIYFDIVNEGLIKGSEKKKRFSLF
jgi:DNA repair protein RadB